MRARIHGVTALLVLAVFAAACSGGATRNGAGTPSPVPSTADHSRHAGAGAHLGHHVALPPLELRLAAATPAQRAATADLLARTRAALAAYTSESAARGAGFVPANATKRVIHYRNVANRRDDHELDPVRPEGLVYLRDATGGLRLLGALYTVRPGEPAPTPGGNVFSWHTHDPVCGSFLVPGGGCTDTFRMLHVWTAPGAHDPWIQPVREAFGRS
jgi:hypothetical protein